MSALVKSESPTVRTRALGPICDLRRAVASLENRADTAVIVVGFAPSRPATHSLLLWNPADRIIFDREDLGCPFGALEAAMHRWPSCGAPRADIDQPFRGAWVGFFTYEAGLRTEGIRVSHLDELRVPLLRFALYDTAAVYDHATGHWMAVAVEWPDGADRPDAGSRLNAVVAQLSHAGSSMVDSCGCSAIATSAPVIPAARLSRAEHLRCVERILEYLRAGDVYQVNLAVRFDVPTQLTPSQFYLSLRDVNPAPYAALLQYEHMAVVSASPELFLAIRNGNVVTRPIKGTRPRTGNQEADSAAADDLRTSEKDRAELAMIIDLLRNDLGRICEYGSVRVVDEGTIEVHPTVLHRVATIEGRLRDHVAWSEILRATCPGGSVTGAPKIRAMQIIDELEPVPRGAYCGCIGVVGLDGSMILNLAIRTVTMTDGLALVHAGGGIVADSDPAREYAEIEAKARGIMCALGAVWPDT